MQQDNLFDQLVKLPKQKQLHLLYRLYGAFESYPTITDKAFFNMVEALIKQNGED